MFLPEKIDYDRLHSVVDSINNGVPTPRRAGRTFAFMHLMSGELLLGDFNNTYLYVTYSRDFALHVMREFVEYATQLCGPNAVESISPSNLTVVTAHHQRYVFTGVERISCRIQGLSISRAFVDVQPQDREWLLEIYTHVIPSGDVLF